MLLAAGEEDPVVELQRRIAAGTYEPVLTINLRNGNVINKWQVADLNIDVLVVAQLYFVDGCIGGSEQFQR